MLQNPLGRVVAHSLQTGKAMQDEVPDKLSSLTEATRQAQYMQFLRIAEGREVLEGMARRELDPERQEALWNALAEAVCI